MSVSFSENSIILKIVAKLKLDLHEIYNKGWKIGKALEVDYRAGNFKATHFIGALRLAMSKRGV